MGPIDGEIKPAALERHYSVAQVAEMWGWSDDKVRRCSVMSRAFYRARYAHYARGEGRTLNLAFLRVL